MRIPEVRALCAGARRPTIRFLLGTTLMIPAGASMARTNDGSVSEGLTADPVAVTAEVEARNAVARAWRAKVMERQREALSRRFAEQFSIPLNLADEIHLAALREKIDPSLAFGLVRAESSFRTRAVSPVGALGLTQVMPSTARWLAPGTTARDLLDPRTNLRLGFRYLRQLIDLYNGDKRLALTAYNRGPGTVDRLLSIGLDPDNGYAELVLAGYSARHVALMNAKFGVNRKAD